jgi:hypothetical protein
MAKWVEQATLPGFIKAKAELEDKGIKIIIVFTGATTV